MKSTPVNVSSIECLSAEDAEAFMEKTGKRKVSGVTQPVVITVNQQSVSDFDALQYELSSKKFQLEADGKKPLVVLELDPRLTFQNVVWTVNAAKKARFANISFTPPGGVPRQ